MLQLSMSLSAITSGPSLGIFSMGVLVPWINANVRIYYSFSRIYGNDP